MPPVCNFPQGYELGGNQTRNETVKIKLLSVSVFDAIKLLGKGILNLKDRNSSLHGMHSGFQFNFKISLAFATTNWQPHLWCLGVFKQFPESIRRVSHPTDLTS
ncbi:hypothetical protein CEXT_732141 [Caerostris extrusa]|uniref:Uncharacterized protein n=1 Tax=Caerostris extrusa TaxID=172846 RepID=A0AAV4T1R5_CAEEX|nr:hypothetical protein CEXT_732141 [Caerostris extrusa]